MLEARRLAAELKARLTADDIMCRTASPSASSCGAASQAAARAIVDNADCDSNSVDSSDRQMSAAEAAAPRPRTALLGGGGLRGIVGSSIYGGCHGSSSHRQLARRRSRLGSSHGRPPAGTAAALNIADACDSSCTPDSRSSLCGSASAAGSNACRLLANSSAGTAKRRRRTSRTGLRVATAVATAALDTQAANPLVVAACNPSVRPVSHAGWRPASSLAAAVKSFSEGTRVASSNGGGGCSGEGPCNGGCGGCYVVCEFLSHLPENFCPGCALRQMTMLAANILLLLSCFCVARMCLRLAARPRRAEVLCVGVVARVAVDPQPSVCAAGRVLRRTQLLQHFCAGSCLQNISHKHLHAALQISTRVLAGGCW